MPGNALNDTTFYGACNQGTVKGTDYFVKFRVGAGTPSYADVTGGLLCNVLEVATRAHFKGTITQYIQAHVLQAPNSAADALILGRAAGNPWLTIDTLSNQVKVGKKLETNFSGGVYNEANAGKKVATTRQAQWLKYPLGNNSGVGGTLSADNPWGATGIIYKVALKVEAGSSATSHLDVGIGTTAVADIFKSLPTTAAGSFLRSAASGGGSGTSGRAVLWGTSDSLLVTPSAAGGMSNFSGSLYVLAKQLD